MPVKDGSWTVKFLTGSDDCSENNTKKVDMDANCLLEIPITRREAHRRGLPERISKLVIYFDLIPCDGKGWQEIAFLLSILNRLQDAQRKLYAQPLGSYLSLDKYSSALSERAIQYVFDGQYTKGSRAKPRVLTAKCDTKEKQEAVLEIFQSDGVAFFLSENYQAGGALEAALRERHNWRVGFFQFRSRGYEEDYLRQVDKYGVFAFYENTKVSLEFLGHKDEILRVFSVAFAPASLRGIKHQQ